MYCYTAVRGILGVVVGVMAVQRLRKTAHNWLIYKFEEENSMRLAAKGLFQCACCKKCKNWVNLMDFTPEGIADRRKKCAVCTDRPPLEDAFADLVAGYIYLDCKGKDPEFSAQATRVKQMVKQGFGVKKISQATGITEAKLRRAINVYGLRYTGEENLGRANKRRKQPEPIFNNDENNE